MNHTLTRKDLIILMKLLGAKSLIGIPNPFLTSTKEEVEFEWEYTFKKLHKLSLVDLVDNEVKFEQAFIEAMWVIARTNVIVEIDTTDSKKSLFYFSDDSVIECTRISEEEYTIYTHYTPDETWNQVILPRMLMGVEELPIRFNQSFLISPEDYREYCKHGKVHNPEQIEKANMLVENHSLVKQFNRSLERKIYTNRLMMFYHTNQQWNVEGLHILTSPSFNWILEMVNRDSKELLETKQATAPDIVTSILAIINRVKQDPTEYKKDQVKNFV